jgi:F0F1-type ATP synthase membrane subunit c/vacuolar-type H+-ATPase subunit K
VIDYLRRVWADCCSEDAEMRLATRLMVFGAGVMVGVAGCTVAWVLGVGF